MAGGRDWPVTDEKASGGDATDEPDQRLAVDGDGVTAGIVPFDRLTLFVSGAGENRLRGMIRAAEPEPGTRCRRRGAGR